MQQTIASNMRRSNLVPMLALLITAFVMIAVPMKIISYGFLPPDDALRHSAKAVSGRSWGEILVVRDGITMDSHPGWHAVLGAVHKSFGTGADGLVVFSVISIFLAFCSIPILLTDRPESWLSSLLLISLTNASVIGRILMGRPYVITMAALVIICSLWRRLSHERTDFTSFAVILIAVAISTWIHGSWYLWALPVLCFFAAREFRAGRRIALAITLGVALGVVFTGNPIAFLRQTFEHAIRAFGSHQLQRMLVVEFQPTIADKWSAILLVFLLFLRSLRGKWDVKRIDDPVFILCLTAWSLALVSRRFWLDWGMPAFSVWIAYEVYDLIRDKLDFYSWKRVLFTTLVAACFYLSLSSDITGRWTSNLTTEYLSTADAEQKAWLPEPGGILYSDSMLVFYQTFFKNPDAPWRYMLGFEPTWMPPEDLEIFRIIQWNHYADKAFAPWVNKMRTIDRLVISRPRSGKPNIQGLDWYYAATNIWIGRIPKE